MAEHLLSSFIGKLKLKVRGSNLKGEDVNFEAGMDLSKSDSSRVALLTRLCLYLLQTRGRLTIKVIASDSQADFVLVFPPHDIEMKVSYLQLNRSLIHQPPIF